MMMSSYSLIFDNLQEIGIDKKDWRIDINQSFVSAIYLFLRLTLVMV